MSGIELTIVLHVNNADMEGNYHKKLNGDYVQLVAVIGIIRLPVLRMGVNRLPHHKTR